MLQLYIVKLNENKIAEVVFLLIFATDPISMKICKMIKCVIEFTNEKYATVCVLLPMFCTMCYVSRYIHINIKAYALYIKYIVDT